jgi:hypothetical protein
MGVQHACEGSPRLLQDVTVDRAPEQDITVAFESLSKSGRIVEEVSRVLEGR